MFQLCWAAGLLLVLSCTEQHEPRASPVVARRLGGDSMVPGAVLKVCTAADEGCMPTYPVACSEKWAGDPAQRLDLPALSPELEGWCAAQGAAGAPSP